jgi:PIN domain nuclease of toxin-antitoxin system
MNERFVLDTHALFFYLADSKKLKPGARDVFDRFNKGKVTLFIPWIVIAELFWLARKRASGMDFNTEFQRLQDHPRVMFVGLDAEQVSNFPNLDKVTEMHDRIIVGVAYKLGVPLITRDRNIEDSGYIMTIWD